jgi:hypothetical protein
MEKRAIQLETYKGQSSRGDCQHCGGKKTFAHYVFSDTGERIHHTCGRCNREDQCSYHLTPKEFFAANGITPSFDVSYDRRNQAEPFKQPSFIDTSTMMNTCRGYEFNVFVQWMISVFGTELVRKAIERYYIGTATRGRVIFWQIDSNNRIRTGKIMSYDKDGHRSKKYHPNWVHSFKRDGKALYPGYTLKQCLFGEHLATLDKKSAIAICESEKTAIIASIYLPKYIWMATGGKNGISIDRLQRLKGRKLVLFPDLNGYSDWKMKATEISALLPGTSIKVSNILERGATDEERNKGLDLADYLLIKPIDNSSNSILNHIEELIKMRILIPKGIKGVIGEIEVSCVNRTIGEIIEGFHQTYGKPENTKWINHINNAINLCKTFKQS